MPGYRDRRYTGLGLVGFSARGARICGRADSPNRARAAAKQQQASLHRTKPARPALGRAVGVLQGTKSGAPGRAGPTEATPREREPREREPREREPAPVASAPPG